MYELNENFSKFPGGYLFALVREKTLEYKRKNPQADIISLGVGDVTRPLAPAVVDALQKATAEQADAKTFRGYGPYAGYEFLREAICEKDFASRNVKIKPDEVFVNDGAKSDAGGISELFGKNNAVAVCDPTYPVYVDSNVLAGRAGIYSKEQNGYSDIVYLSCTKENGFLPQIPQEGQKVPSLIYLCFPNNPTGVMISKAKLQEWVDYAYENKSVILYDAAYVSFIESDDAPHTIYECDHAKECAIEMRSYSKTAGFTGLRLGYTVIPKELERNGLNLNEMWMRRLGVRYNGAPYIIQRAAEAIYTPEGEAQVKEQIQYYKQNTKTILTKLKGMGIEAFGGKDAPYVWMKTPNHMTSWEFFDFLLDKANVIGTPGSGFGSSGEGYFRLTGFGTKEQTLEALNRMTKIL